jgi:hypothetical protein
LKRVRDSGIKDVKTPIDQFILRFALEAQLLGATLLRSEEVAWTSIALS